MKNIKWKILLGICFVFILTFNWSVLADNQLVDPNVPESWYHAPKLASEMGIDEFHQSPLLDERVKKGVLPPVDKRLPEDPPVIEPFKEVGKYGGTANTWGINLDSYFNSGAWLLQPYAHLGRPTPDGQEEVPYLAKGWEYSDDYKKLTLYFRKGLKWSDGKPFSANDYMYWWNYVAQNKDLTPVPPEKWKPVGLIDVKKESDYAVTFVFNKPDPTRDHEFHIWCWWGVVQPAHYMKQFHPGFVDENKLVSKAKESGFDYWYEYYNYMASETHPERGVRPTLRPYVAVKRTQSYLLSERNPYYPFVDTEGNQLPYIDKIKLNLAADADMPAMKAATGEATIAGIALKTTDIPLYKKNEKKGDYKTLIYTSGRGSALAVMVNLAHENPKLRKIFQDVRFRKALSLAIDRKEINDKVFYGMGVPRQATVIPTSIFFKQEYAEAYADFDPARAKKILNEMGMVDVNNDGYRERPDGEIFNPTLIYNKHEGPRTPILELLDSYWDDIGLNVDLKMVSRELKVSRWEANNFDMGEWHIDRVTDILMPRALSKTFAPTIPSPNPYSPWPALIQWYSTDGKEGIEPPAKIKEIINYGEKFVRSVEPAERKKAGEKLVKAQAENLWTIGTVGLIPWPVIISNDLKNVPETGYWSDDLQYLDTYYPSQFYLEK